MTHFKKCLTNFVVASVSETPPKMGRLKPKDLSSYFRKFTDASNNSRKFNKILTCKVPGFMSYSTSRIDHPCTAVSFSSSADLGMTIPAHLNDDLCDHDVHLEMEAAQNSEDGFVEEHFVIAHPKPSRNIIPEEHDLIDSVADLETEELTSITSDQGRITEVINNVPDSNSASSLKKSVKPKSKKKPQNKLKTSDKEELAKVKRDELERLAKEVGLNRSLGAYLDICVFNKQLNRALITLNHYRTKSRLNRSNPPVTDVNTFNSLIHAYAERGNIVKVREIFKSIQEEGLKPSIQSYAAVLECLGRLPPTASNQQRISWFLVNLKKDGHDLQDLFNKTVYSGNQREIVLQALRRHDPAFHPKIVKPSTNYNCGLLKNITANYMSPIISPAAGLISLENLRRMAKKQFEMELKGTITIKSVEQKEGLENLPHYRKLLEETEEKWAVAIKEALNRSFVSLVHQGMKFKTQRTIGLYPFLRVLEPKDYVDIIIQEIRKLAEGSETYSPTVSQLYRELGAKVLSRYQVLYKKEKGILEKVRQLYDDYLEWYLDASTHNEFARSHVPHYKIRNSRQMWQGLLFDPECMGPDVDINEKAWPNSVLSSVGRFLYGIIMRDIKINTQVMKLNTRTEHMVPAFYSIFRLQGIHLKEEIKPHPALVKLFQAASKDELTFDTNLVPMISPPLPWASIRTGGYLLTPAKIIRLPFQAHQQKVLLESCPPENLYPSLDSLNQLAAVPWKINHKVLDTVTEVFNNKGDDSLGIPPPPSECPLPPVLDPSMSRQEKLKVHKTRLALKRQKAEMYSLWCDALYRLSLANHFREDIFWFPHNMDFRGRVYPCPPHLNHLGADMARSILVFAKGRPLGPNGLNWLKIHLVNLTGLKKKDSVDDRLKYANEKLDDILDSADKPLTGRKWWAESEEPWQTLACCIEIANAIRSEDPTSYVSHFPVHQDGSCNGLQHYAALGRDQAGAESVNLAPSRLPQDVYSAVAALVEKLRDQDAKNGVKIAQTLEGFVKRKVIKQTVMTTVYGVTRYGARLQIAKQLKDIPDFPKEHVWAASLYLVGKTFDSLQEMFTSTKEIQDWFTECARLISQICAQNVEWVTPLGLPVVQPYFSASKRTYEPYNPMKVSDAHIFDMFERPNVMKQKNAFPPNFIHSLDSSHMMLTSLHSEQAGITFVSVHDCYWTHPCSVEVMNKICREQFVAMHLEPILEDLSKFMVAKYSYKDSEILRDGSISDNSKKKLNHLLTQVPTKGSFDLSSVLKSTYFFS